MHVILGRMYEDNPEYADYFNRREPGFVAWLREIIETNAQANGADLETVTWP